MATYVETSLQVKWERKNDLRHHLRKLEAIRKRAQPHFSPPITLSRPSNPQRSFSIERENIHLVRRLFSISTRKQPQPRSFSVSLHKFIRRRRWEQIFTENEKLSQKLGKINSDLSKNRLEASYVDVEKYRNLSSKTRLVELAERVTRSRFDKTGKNKLKKESSCDMVL